MWCVTANSSVAHRQCSVRNTNCLLSRRLLEWTGPRTLLCHAVPLIRVLDGHSSQQPDRELSSSSAADVRPRLYRPFYRVIGPFVQTGPRLALSEWQVYPAPTNATRSSSSCGNHTILPLVWEEGGPSVCLEGTCGGMCCRSLAQEGPRTLGMGGFHALCRRGMLDGTPPCQWGRRGRM